MSTSRFPVSVILDGPVFRNELEYPPQQLRKSHDVDSLRLVPAKSAASGVHGIYFVPEHREWALVRLARRYRWLLEILLNRGLSGEQQLLNQSFSDADVDFLFEIFPHPPEQHNPIVYDILWLVATYDQYLTLTRAILEAETFIPRQLIERTPDVSVEDIGFFTRFLRSHLIQPAGAGSVPMHSRSTRSRSDLSIDPVGTYVVTDEGEDALRGILSEYERVFNDGQFEPLLINHDLDPVEHLRAFKSRADTEVPDIELDELRDDDGILGDIADSFVSLPAADVPDSSETSSTDRSEVIQDNPHSPSVSRECSAPDTESNVPQRRSHSTSGQPSRHDEQESDEQSSVTAADGSDFGSFSDDEILEATLVAARTIREHSLAQTTVVKKAVWESIDDEGRDMGQLWEYVSQVLLRMDSVCGRPDGRVWAAV